MINNFFILTRFHFFVPERLVCVTSSIKIIFFWTFCVFGFYLWTLPSTIGAVSFFVLFFSLFKFSVCLRKEVALYHFIELIHVYDCEQQCHHFIELTHMWLWAVLFYWTYSYLTEQQCHHFIELIHMCGYEQYYFIKLIHTYDYAQHCHHFIELIHIYDYERYCHHFIELIHMWLWASLSSFY